MSNSPQDPITDLAAGAAQLHELFTAYIQAGFTENQALRLLVGVLTSGISGGR